MRRAQFLCCRALSRSSTRRVIFPYLKAEVLLRFLRPARSWAKCQANQLRRCCSRGSVSRDSARTRLTEAQLQVKSRRRSHSFRSQVKISHPFLLLIFISAGAIAGRACDLCGCYTPQLEAMPGMESHPLLPALADGTLPSVTNSLALPPCKWTDTRSRIRPGSTKTARLRS
jgi:hypothetical protein